MADEEQSSAEKQLTICQLSAVETTKTIAVMETTFTALIARIDSRLLVLEERTLQTPTKIAEMLRQLSDIQVNFRDQMNSVRDDFKGQINVLHDEIKQQKGELAGIRVEIKELGTKVEVGMDKVSANTESGLNKVAAHTEAIQEKLTQHLVVEASNNIKILSAIAVAVVTALVGFYFHL